MAFDTLWIFAAAYETEEAAKADYDAVKELYKSTGLIDTYDAAVFTKGKDGKVDVVHKHEEPTRQGALGGLTLGLAAGALVALFPAVAIGAGLVVGGAAGAGLGAVAGHVAAGLDDSDVKELGDLLDEGQSGLIVIAASDMEAKVEGLLQQAGKLAKKQVRADAAELEKQIDELTKAH
jgi:uncharacterized membrane protein